MPLFAQRFQNSPHRFLARFGGNRADADLRSVVGDQPRHPFVSWVFYDGTKGIARRGKPRTDHRETAQVRAQRDDALTFGRARASGALRLPAQCRGDSLLWHVHDRHRVEHAQSELIPRAPNDRLAFRLVGYRSSALFSMFASMRLRYFHKNMKANRAISDVINALHRYGIRGSSTMKLLSAYSPIRYLKL